MAALALGSRKLPRREGVWGLLKGEGYLCQWTGHPLSCMVGFPFQNFL